MKTQITANQLNGRATGALFFAGFGALWLLLGLETADRMTASAVFAVGVGFALFLGLITQLFRKARNFPKVEEDAVRGRMFGRINAIQWIAIAVVAIGLDCLQKDIYIPSAVSVIVGLHLFPLARLFRYPLHYATAIAAVIWAGICLSFFPLEQLQSATAFGMGLILWLSAAAGIASGLLPRGMKDRMLAAARVQ